MADPESEQRTDLASFVECHPVLTFLIFAIAAISLSVGFERLIIG
jgi:hypothetical protein